MHLGSTVGNGATGFLLPHTRSSLQQDLISATLLFFPLQSLDHGLKNALVIYPKGTFSGMDMSSACVSIWFVPLSGHVRSWGTLEVDSWDLGSDRRSAGLLFQSFILSRTFLPLGVHHPGTHKLFLSDYRWEVLFFPALLPCSPSSSNAAAWPRLMKPHQVSQAGL